MATDIVAGLRVLRGIGGEATFGRNYAEQSQRTRRAGVSAGLWQAAIEATGVLLSGGFLVLLMWAGTRRLLTGELSVGQLISFLGYGLFMLGPIQTFFEFAQKLTRALVSARKAIRSRCTNSIPMNRPASIARVRRLARLAAAASGRSAVSESNAAESTCPPICLRGGRSNRRK